MNIRRRNKRNRVQGWVVYYRSYFIIGFFRNRKLEILVINKIGINESDL